MCPRRLLRYARQHEAADPRGITYVHGDAKDLAAFADRSFDGVVCHMALMDIPDLAPTIGSVARVLRGGGWFVFSIVHPCYRGHVDIVTDYLVDHRYRKRLPTDWLPAHAYHRPLGTYVDQLAQAGFRNRARRGGASRGIRCRRRSRAALRPSRPGVNVTLVVRLRQPK